MQSQSLLLFSDRFTMLWYTHICSIVMWFGEINKYVDRIFKLQKKLERIMLFNEYNHESKPLFQQLNILNIYQTK